MMAVVLFVDSNANARVEAYNDQLMSIEKDVNGNYIMILLTIMEKDILLVNIYGQKFNLSLYHYHYDFFN